MSNDNFMEKYIEVDEFIRTCYHALDNNSKMAACSIDDAPGLDDHTLKLIWNKSFTYMPVLWLNHRCQYAQCGFNARVVILTCIKNEQFYHKLKNYTESEVNCSINASMELWFYETFITEYMYNYNKRSDPVYSLYCKNQPKDRLEVYEILDAIHERAYLSNRLRELETNYLGSIGH